MHGEGRSRAPASTRGAPALLLAVLLLLAPVLAGCAEGVRTAAPGSGAPTVTLGPPAGTAGPATATGVAPSSSLPPGTSPTSTSPTGPAAPSAAPTTPTPTSPRPSTAAVPPSPTPGPRTGPTAGGATPAPTWLGTRPLGPAGSGPVEPQRTPPELRDRRIATVDVLPPPPDDRFTAEVGAVPEDVLRRSTWQPACPVAADELRYATVSFWGFDGRHHTGELLLHADAVDAVVGAFRAMHAERFPLEEVRVVRADELTAAPTGDGNTTSAFVCRPAVGSTRWSQHAYGRALDVNPFHNPFTRGSGDDRVVIPELATAYTDRDRRLPGMLDETSAAVRALTDAGWGWGGAYTSRKDWMHLSADGS